MLLPLLPLSLVPMRTLKPDSLTRLRPLCLLMTRHGVFIGTPCQGFYSSQSLLIFRRPGQPSTLHTGDLFS